MWLDDPTSPITWELCHGNSFLSSAISPSIGHSNAMTHLHCQLKFPRLKRYSNPSLNFACFNLEDFDGTKQLDKGHNHGLCNVIICNQPVSFICCPSSSRPFLIIHPLNLRFPASYFPSRKFPQPISSSIPLRNSGHFSTKPMLQVIPFLS